MSSCGAHGWAREHDVRPAAASTRRSPTHLRYPLGALLGVEQAGDTAVEAVVLMRLRDGGDGARLPAVAGRQRAHGVQPGDEVRWHRPQRQALRLVRDAAAAGEAAHGLKDLHLLVRAQLHSDEVPVHIADIPEEEKGLVAAGVLWRRVVRRRWGRWRRASMHASRCGHRCGAGRRPTSARSCVAATPAAGTEADWPDRSRCRLGGTGRRPRRHRPRRRHRDKRHGNPMHGHWHIKGRHEWLRRRHRARHHRNWYPMALTPPASWRQMPRHHRTRGQIDKSCGRRHGWWRRRRHRRRRAMVRRRRGGRGRRILLQRKRRHAVQSHDRGGCDGGRGGGGGGGSDPHLAGRCCESSAVPRQDGWKRGGHCARSVKPLARVSQSTCMMIK